MSSMFQVTLDIKKNRVLKSGPSQFLELEALMTNKAHAVSRNYENFRVPKVFSFDGSLGILEMEFIPDISPLKNLVYEKVDFLDLLSKTAEAIFTIHEKLFLENHEIFYLPSKFMDRASVNSAIHGDFTLDNVQYDIIKKIPVLIDWSFCPKFNVPANYGSWFFDLAFMINSIFSSPPYSYIFCSKEKYMIGMCFIESYFKLGKSFYEYKKFKHYLQKVSRLFYQKSKNESRLVKKFRERKNRISFIKFADSL